MKKKIFKLSLLISAILISANLHAQEIALQLYSLREQMKTDVSGSHQLVADWGIKNLEGGGTYGMAQEEYKKMLKALDLSIVAVGADYNKLKENPQEIIDNAKAYGAKYATCFWIPHTSGNFSFKEAMEAVELFNKTGKMFKDAGITLTYHPHGYEFKTHGDGFLFDYILENARNFDFNMDVFWVQMGGGDPLAIMKKYPSKFPLLHLKDRAHGTPGSSDGSGDVETNVVLGTGDVDIKGLIKQAQKSGTKYLIIEDESSRSVEQIPQSVAYIKKVMAEK
ncbi:sugar phosphate isomerase [Rhodonellum psychrophilum GCM71 = DSM 17998]|uniref:Sugar phosphate isomerase n=2 Tax=Rhodonellum TaxID=336827 RepID=U5BVN9_9BACT|nr:MULTISPECIES: sugar phosphate isomerase/epimerase [Rhodonellum]ERM84715.1 sugar phosphate isomerase [Rhodonellum psychrophilum GCM71 = DSM 17998]SDZ12783.1 Sugar phosphate isomerase/epimerase [Rhodonellum ikkaensis]